MSKNKKYLGKCFTVKDVRSPAQVLFASGPSERHKATKSLIYSLPDGCGIVITFDCPEAHPFDDTAIAMFAQIVRGDRAAIWKKMVGLKKSGNTATILKCEELFNEEIATLRGAIRSLGKSLSIIGADNP